jgi:hypothetical protein
MEETKNIQHYARQAIEIQDACNLQAVLNCYVKALSFLLTIMSRTEAFEHAISKMFADKIHSLTIRSDNDFMKYSDECEKIAKQGN